VEDNYDEIIDPNSELYIAEIAQKLTNTYSLARCNPNFGTILTNGQLIIGESYLINVVSNGDNFINVGYTSNGVLFTATATTPTTWANGTILNKTNCNIPILESSKNTIGVIDYKIPVGTPLRVGEEYIINELIAGDDFTNVGFVKKSKYFVAIQATPTIWTSTEISIRDRRLIESIFPTQYEDTIIKNVCNIYKSGGDGGVQIDERTRDNRVLQYIDGTYADGESYEKLMPCGQVIVERDIYITNNSANEAESIQHLTGPTSNINVQNYFNDYLLSEVQADLISDKVATPIGDWGAFLTKKALWFKSETDKKRFVFEVTPQKLPKTIKDNVSNGTTVRLSLYRGKTTATAPFYTKLVDLTQGSKFLFEKATNGFNITDELGGVINVSI
jgi:hypothetical protein